MQGYLMGLVTGVMLSGVVWANGFQTFEEQAGGVGFGAGRIVEQQQQQDWQTYRHVQEWLDERPCR